MTIHRRAWTMRLQKGAEAAYDKAHAEIWPDLLQQMKADGIRSFLLFRSGLTVFAVQERALPFPLPIEPPSEITARWWREMARLMVTDSTGRPVRTELREVFSLDDSLPQKETTE
jgi:L-rhamnose mutarotase